jgi:hypothetical protein
MKDLARSSREKKTLKTMIKMYCRANHGTKDGLCTDCTMLHDYASGRIEKCPFHEKKPVCGKCRVHCYKPDMRKRIRAVMRYSGPKMLLSHPVQGIMHIIDRFRYKADKSSRS